MCQRDDRDEHGRFRPGASGNPAGKPPRKPFLRLLEAAAACGAEVVVMCRPVAPAPPLPATRRRGRREFRPVASSRAPRRPVGRGRRRAW